MTFFEPYFSAFPVIMTLMTLVWIVSVFMKNASIVDPVWGLGFVVAALFYFFQTDASGARSILLLVLVVLWGLRLSVFLFWRNAGKDEDYRYQNFRKNYGPKRYWWVSFFQVFLLQGTLLWIISAPLLGVMYFTESSKLNFLDGLAVLLWLIGFVFEAGGDYQLARFKANPANAGKVMNKGFWKFTRHPNYFGDAAVWWSFGLFSMAAGCFLPILGSLLMTFLLVKISGVAMLEKSLKNNKPDYLEYVRKTSAFVPWFPKKS